MATKSSFTNLLSCAALIVAVVALLRPSVNTSLPSSTSLETTFERTVRTKELSVCYVVWAPSVIKDPNSGKLSGFLIEMAERIAEEAGFNLKYIESSWGGFPADLSAGKCDVGVAGFYPLIPRSTAVSFTLPFYYAGNSGVVRADDGRFSSISNLNDSTVKIAVLQGEFGHVYSKRYFPKAKLIILEKSADNTAPLLAVSSGQADVGLIMEDVVKGYVNSHPEVKPVFAEPYSSTPVSWAVRRNDQQLLNFLNNAIKYLEVTGELEALAAKYNSSFLTLDQKLKSPAS